MDGYPAELRDILLPFKCIFVDVDDIGDAMCINQFSPRLGAFITAMKYARDPDAHKETFKKMLDRFDKPSLDDGTLDLLTSIDVYLHQWLSKNFKEKFRMDFVRAPYKTIADVEREEREALEKQLADKDKFLAEKDKENASQAAEIARLKAALAAKQN